MTRDEYLVKLCKLHVSLLSGGHPKAIFGDSIAMKNGAASLLGDVPDGGFDVLLTNPPFGTKIVAATPAVMEQFEIAHKWRPNATGNLEPTAELQTRVPPQVLSC